MPITRNRRRIALDADTALEDGQWEKLQAFLTPLLDEDQMATVEEICRGGGDAPEGKPSAGASDTAIAYDTVLDREVQALQTRHRAGHISEGQLVTGIRAINARRRTKPLAQDRRAGVTPLDKLEAEFPHMNRLKL